jgi:hypothetical protein
MKGAGEEDKVRFNLFLEMLDAFFFKRLRTNGCGDRNCNSCYGAFFSGDTQIACTLFKPCSAAAVASRQLDTHLYLFLEFRS